MSLRQPNQIASGNPKEGGSTKKLYTRDHSWVHLGGKWTTTPKLAAAKFGDATKENSPGVAVSPYIFNGNMEKLKI